MPETDQPTTEKTSVRCAIDVVAGVLVGTPESEFTRTFYITSEAWNEKGANQANLLTDMSGKATAYATYLMLQPDRLNWVRLDWVWF